MSRIELGDRVKDPITGFSGIAVARTTWLHGCDRIVIQPETLDKDGKTKDNQSFDEPQIVRLKAAAVKGTPQADRATAPGGPRDDKAATRVKA
jgi:hypothetical protein